MICKLKYQSKQTISKTGSHSKVNPAPRSWDVGFRMNCQSALILLLFSNSVFAANGHIYLGGIVGASKTRVGNNNPTINYYDGNLTDAYPIHKRQTNRTLMGINGGYELEGVGLIPVSALGLGIYDSMPKNHDYNGQVIETAIGDSSSTLYNYKFHVANTRLMLEGQLAWIFFEKFVPSVNIGIGTAWNRISGYTESSVDSTDCVALPPPFKSHTNNNFAYQAGLGLGYAFNFKHTESEYLHERISLSYRYINSGNVSTGTRGAVYPFHLKMGRLASNEIYLVYAHSF